MLHGSTGVARQAAKHMRNTLLCVQVVGTLTEEASTALGLPTSVIVSGGSGDNAMSALGVGCVVGIALIRLLSKSGMPVHKPLAALQARPNRSIFLKPSMPVMKSLAASQIAGVAGLPECAGVKVMLL